MRFKSIFDEKIIFSGNIPKAIFGLNIKNLQCRTPAKGHICIIFIKYDLLYIIHGKSHWEKNLF